MLVLMVAASIGADGYTKQVSFAQLQHEKTKTGEVYKVRQYKVELTTLEENRVQAELFSDVREAERTVKLTVTKQQSKFLELSAWNATAGSIFLRKTAAGWEYLGSKISRDPNGQTVFQY